MIGSKGFHPLKIVVFMAFAVVFVLLFGAIVQWLWNATLPELVGVNQISYWQAVGLLLLSKILFGNFGGKPGKYRSKKSSWKHRWMNMSEEEKASYRQKWKERCRPRQDDETV